MMEFGYVDSLEYIDIDIRKIDFSQTLEKDSCENPPQQKHVRFAAAPQIINCTCKSNSIENFKVSSIQPVSILKKTDYKYSKYNQWMKNIDDALWLLLIISMLAFSEKFLKILF